MCRRTLAEARWVCLGVGSRCGGLIKRVRRGVALGPILCLAGGLLAVSCFKLGSETVGCSEGHGVVLSVKFVLWQALWTSRRRGAAYGCPAGGRVPPQPYPCGGQGGQGC